MDLSVIIPAYNEAENIGNALAALRDQTLGRDRFETIVVDNNSADDTYEKAVEFGSDHVLKETEQGTNPARQAGYEKSIGEIVVFLDADCIPPPDWLERLVAIFADKAVMAVSGPCDLGFKGLYRFIEIVYTRYFFPVLGNLLYLVFRKKAGVILGGNFAVRRAAVEKIGGLPSIKFHGDDSAIAMLISRHAGTVRFDPTLVVTTSPRRFTREGHLKLTLVYAWYYINNYFRIK
jgi:glycosyltransferase involved in cell wall biosynthesis